MRTRVVLFLGVLLVSGCGERAPATAAVRIENFVYVPATVEVQRGDTVAFTNADVFPHTVTDSARSLDSGSLAQRQTWRYVAEQEGRFPYYCVFHPTMRGEIVVR